ncbi:unnamed protein product [Leptidea sinapis]|uniref:Uncharacterized protein n=1 Tax=Leptidea sinapis TaxID=189913 RepID=A0A5E4QBR6_9NEOP|nr:unnamed protein product [Leptidea sinapis]
MYLELNFGLWLPKSEHYLAIRPPKKITKISESYVSDIDIPLKFRQTSLHRVTITTNVKREKRDFSELLQRVEDIFKQDLKIIVEASDVSKIHRIGSIKESKIRPVLITFANNWKRSEILKKKKDLKDGYITEDFPKEKTDEEKSLTERATVLQSECSEWLELRRSSLTASNLGKVVTRRNDLSMSRKRRLGDLDIICVLQDGADSEDGLDFDDDSLADPDFIPELETVEDETPEINLNETL